MLSSMIITDVSETSNFKWHIGFEKPVSKDQQENFALIFLKDRCYQWYDSYNLFVI